jgi:benzoyl-CoA reductase subunit A
MSEGLAIGIDAGSTTTKLVAVDADGRMLGWRLESAEPRTEEQVGRMLGELCRELGRGENIPTVATGYGRKLILKAARSVTEISCHARGVFAALGRSGTLVDIGGQDSKVIRIGPGGKATDFSMNDKCAAGTGRGMEVIADVLSVPIEDIGRRSFEIDEEPPPVSNVCTVFAKSEATSLLRAGWSVDRVLASYCAAMAQRVAGLIERVGVRPQFFITGGIAKNVGVTRRIERLIGMEALRLPEDSVLDPQIAGALGAALFAHSLNRKVEKEKSAAGAGSAPAEGPTDRTP